jgi:hypothetical protein
MSKSLVFYTLRFHVRHLHVRGLDAFLADFNLIAPPQPYRKNLVYVDSTGALLFVNSSLYVALGTGYF